jgi:hypothetical protein
VVITLVSARIEYCGNAAATHPKNRVHVLTKLLFGLKCACFRTSYSIAQLALISDN